MKTIVLGGGVIGVATAFYLRQQCCEVTVIEREPDVALATSFGNAGVIAPGYVTPWAANGNAQPFSLTSSNPKTSASNTSAKMGRRIAPS